MLIIFKGTLKIINIFSFNEPQRRCSNKATIYKQFSMPIILKSKLTHFHLKEANVTISNGARPPMRPICCFHDMGSESIENI